MDVESPESDNPLWAQAARNLRGDAHGEELKALALRHHREPLRQYLWLRLPSEEQVREALAAIHEQANRWETVRLMAAPGPRAHLFALARTYLVENGIDPTAPSAPESALRHGAEAASGVRQLTGEHGELLELRHARELAPVEIAHVLQVGVPEVQASLEAAEAAGRKALSAPTHAALQIATARTYAATADPEPHAMQTAGDSLPAGTVLGERYTLEKAVGIGAFGQVYRATDNLVEGHHVALKILHKPAKSEEERQAALRELRLIASVFHPSIVSFKDHGWFEGRFWFVMPWYDGEPLESRIAREPLSRAEAVRIFTPLAHALASMHAVGVRHQDIKPDNIFLAELKTDPLGEDQLQPVLLDLGVAATDADSLIAGTPQYFAPEVAAACTGEGYAALTDKADVFSLALALRNALEPETAEEVEGTAVQLFIAQRVHDVPAPPESKSLAFLLPHFARWMAHDPEQRPTAAQFASELQVLLEPERKVQKRAAFLSWFVPVTAAFLVVLAGGAFAWSEQMREQENRAHAAEMQAQREATLRASLEQEHGVLKEEHAETTKARDELATALSDSEAQADKLSSRAAALARQRRAKARELAATEAELGDLTAEAEQLSMSKAELENRVDALNARVRALVDQAKTLDGLLEDNRVLLAKEEQLSADLRDKLERAEATQANLMERLQVMADERKKLADEAKKNDKALRDRDTQIAKLREDVDALKKHVRELQKENRSLKVQAKEQKNPPAAP